MRRGEDDYAIDLPDPLSPINNMAYWIAGSRLRAGVRGGRPAGDGQGGPTPLPRLTHDSRYGKAL